MRENKWGTVPSPALILSLVALTVAIGGTAWAAKKITAKNLANNAVTTKKVKNSAITEAKLADGAVTTGKLANGAATAAKTGMRWALLEGDGTILAQSGGISLASMAVTGDYHLNFGSTQSGKSIQVTPVYRDADPGTGVGAVAALCGGPPAGATCNPPGTNNTSHVYVGISDDAAVPNDQAFYITVF